MNVFQGYNSVLSRLGFGFPPFVVVASQFFLFFYFFVLSAMCLLNRLFDRSVPILAFLNIVFQCRGGR